MVKSNWSIVTILVVFLVVGTLYAAYTPVWQAPDEPAHYNYVRSLSEERRFPIMEQGDYNQEYLSQLTTEKFPPELSVSELEYEDHQPPLYYILAVPVYALFTGSVVSIRLLSLALGAGAIVMAMLVLREIWPNQPGVTHLACGLMAFTPQFVAMMAAVNNDALVLALLWLWLWLALRFIRGNIPSWILGSVLGLILLTKSTGYGVLLLAVLAVYLKHRREDQVIASILTDMVAVFLPALLLGGIWWLRNIVVYGWPDFLGLIRHDEVVVGQPRTINAIAREGFFPFIMAASRTTFQSFWGQFGWMGVVLDIRIYRGLLIFSFCAIVGAVGYLIERIKSAGRIQIREGMVLLIVSAVITAALFLGYNISFIQHQGRYLFPALPVLTIVLSLGLRQLLERKTAVILTVLLMLFIVIVGVWGFIIGDIQFWSLFLLGIAVAVILSTRIIPKSWSVIYGAGLLAAFALLDVVCLFGFIVPMLSGN